MNKELAEILQRAAENGLAIHATAGQLVMAEPRDPTLRTLYHELAFLAQGLAEMEVIELPGISTEIDGKDQIHGFGISVSPKNR